jgi:beta-phosphoglucomutase-like phosphatase (HAD superfamily)
VVTGRDFKESKPNPEIYLYTAKQLGVSSDECVVLEDSTIGITAAKRAGMYTLAHRDLRFNFDQTLADHIFDDFLEAYVYIQNL